MSEPETSTQSSPAYRVEIRATSKPVQMGDKWIGNEWTLLPTVEERRIGTAHRSVADALTFSYSYYGALALAASAMSFAGFDLIETRIVEYRRTVTYTMEHVEELQLAGFVDRMFAASRIAKQERDKQP